MMYLAAIAGLLFGIAYFKDNPHKIYPIVLILLIFGGVAFINYVHWTEVVLIRGSPSQVYQPMVCWTESYEVCMQTANNLTNASYTDVVNGASRTLTVYIGIPVIEEIKNNIGTYFVVGIIIAWIYRFGVSKFENRNKE